MKTRLRVMTTVFAAGGALLLGLSAASASNSPTPPDLTTLTHGMSPTHAGTAKAAALLTGPARGESVFVPITPCRIADTRVAGGALGNNSSRAFYVRGTTGFNTQGGKVGGCGVPQSATAVTANVTIPAVSSGGGYLIGWPYGAPAPHTNFVTYPTGQTVTVNPTFALSAGGDPSLAMKNVGHSAYVVIDVTGYYAPQMEGSVSPAGGLYAGTARMVSASHVGTGSYSVTWDTDVTYCTPTVTPYGGTGYYAEAYNFSGTTTYIHVWYLNSGTVTPVDQYVNVVVTC